MMLRGTTHPLHAWRDKSAPILQKTIACVCLTCSYLYFHSLTLMCRSHTENWKSSACCPYPSICCYYLNCTGLQWLGIGNGRGRRWYHLSPSILGTVLLQWTRLIGIQQGLSPFLPSVFSMPLLFCSVWNRHSELKTKGGGGYKAREHAGTSNQMTHLAFAPFYCFLKSRN